MNQLKILQKQQQRFFGFFTPQKIRISHEKLAEHSGVSRETVTRVLQELRNEKAIHIDDKGAITYIL